MNVRTEFTFFRNTPLTDLENTIHFKSNAERDHYFLSGGHFSKVSYDTGYIFNFVRDRSTVRMPCDYYETQGINYVTWKSNSLKDDRRYYAFVVNIKYVSNGVSEFELIIDGIMTYCQGDFTALIPQQVMIDRQHLPKDEYDRQIMRLRTNSDMLQTKSLEYVHTDWQVFKDLAVLFQCSVDLDSDFGTADNPKLTTSKGTVYDKIASPVDLYYCTYADWQATISKLGPYPWISQNISKIVLVPEDMVSQNNMVPVKTKTKNLDLSKFKRMKNDSKHLTKQMGDLKRLMPAIYDVFHLDKDKEKHLMRSGYCNIELKTFNGQTVPIQPEFLTESLGIDINAFIVTGFDNEIRVHPLKYKTESETGSQHEDFPKLDGTALETSVSYNNFDSVPILVDNYKLSLANNAHQRELTNSQQLTNRLSNVFTGSSDNGIQGRIMDAVSLLSNANPTALMGGITSEYEYYRQQKAQFADMAISSPGVSSMTNTNSFMIANDIFGFAVRYSRIADSDMEVIKRYHQLFGYEQNKLDRLESIETMKVVNFCKFSGNWFLPNTDTNIFKLIKAQLSQGVKFWHNDGSDNPMAQNVGNNTWS